MPHRYRHVLGWYRLIQELREYGIRVICVFDGDERTAAKSHEVRVPLPLSSSFWRY
jgi:flap endonuclease-1